MAAPRDISPGDDELRELGRQARVDIVRTIARAHAGHIGGPMSAVDILVALYFRVLRIRPDEPAWPDRDRFILSKGHSSIALYATMALRGYFPIGELATFDTIDSRLQGHPDMTRLPGIDMSTGSLGLGITAAVGIALGASLEERDFRTYVMLGDGECQEGSVWEAADVACRYRLDNLTAIVDVNGLQQYGWIGPVVGQRKAPFAIDHLRSRWLAFGWRVLEVDGHDPAAIVDSLTASAHIVGQPTVLLARTVKGKGVPFMEDDFSWHARVPTSDELELALAALSKLATT